MKIKIILFITMLSGLVASCNKNDDKDIFYGSIHYINTDKAIAKNMVSQQVPLTGDHTGMIAVYDSLLVCWDPSYQSHLVDVFNIDTGKEIGYFCERGQGPQEAIGVNAVYQFFKKGNDLMTLFYADAEEKLFFWNITQSIRTGTAVYDTIVPYPNDRIFFHFYLSEDSLMLYKPANYINDHKATAPYYEKRTIYTNLQVAKYPIYKADEFINRSVDPQKTFSEFFYTWDVIKPDGSKIAQVMDCLPQLNIIDTRTGKVNGYRLENGPDFSLMNTDMINMKRYYLNVHADDNYIYATYWGKEAWDGRWGVKMPVFNTIHVFNWDGKLVYKLTTDRSFFRVWADTTRNRLYTIDWNTDEVYYIDLRQLN